jgi:hypothetical protein
MRLLGIITLGMVLLAPTPPAPADHPDWTALAKRAEISIVRLDFLRHIEHPLFGDQGYHPSACTAFAIAIYRYATAAHCVEGQEHRVGSTTIHVLLINKELDVAIFEVPGLVKPPLGFIKGESTRGEEVFTLGYGYGQEEPILRVMRVANPAMAYMGEPVESITFDKAFVGGMSGSPVINQFGEVVTIVTQSDALSGWGRPTPDLRKVLKKFL